MERQYRKISKIVDVFEVTTLEAAAEWLQGKNIPVQTYEEYVYFTDPEGNGMIAVIGDFLVCGDFIYPKAPEYFHANYEAIYEAKDKADEA